MRGKVYPLSMVVILLSVISGVLLIAIIGNEGITAAIESQGLQMEKTIVIDAGHGGIDGGATSCTGVLERDINLDIALKLNDLLHLLGYRTALTRSNQDSVATEGSTIAAQKVSDMKNRLKFVNEIDDPIFISIHQNYFGNSKYYGAQVFYGTLEESKTLAKQVQSALVHSINPDSHRQIKRGDGIYLLEKLACPAVLIECGFLSNQTEEALLRDKAYQNHLCIVIASALGTYIRQNAAA